MSIDFDEFQVSGIDREDIEGESPMRLCQGGSSREGSEIDAPRGDRNIGRPLDESSYH